MGWYRELLKGKNVNALWGHVDDAVLDDNKAEDWARALCCKYLGALEAASGNGERAYRLFKKAGKIINEKEKKFSAGILGTIHMTILAETFRSLRNTPYAKFAENARGRARAFFDAPENADWHKEAWKNWLEVKGQDVEFPGLRYWY